MEQLIEQISTDYNLTSEEATGVVTAVKKYLAANPEITSQDSPAAEAIPVEEVKQESMLEEAEDFVKDHVPQDLKEKAEGVLSGVSDQLKGLFK
jgi:hypothetical protein